MVRNTLSLIDNFNQLTPYAVGFDRMFDTLNRYVDNNVSSTGFPPYNIQKVGEITDTSIYNRAKKFYESCRRADQSDGKIS